MRGRVPSAQRENEPGVTTTRYRRSSVRAVLEAAVTDPAQTARLHDALWAVLWNRRHDDVAEPLWAPDASYRGMLAFAELLDGDGALAGLDCGDVFLTATVGGDLVPIGSAVRIVAATRGVWRIAEARTVGLGVTLRFDNTAASADTGWTAILRGAVERLRVLLEARRQRLTASRAALGALSEPTPVETIWRDEIAAISERVTVETEYTAAEHAALARARARGGRTVDEEERRVAAARRQRFTVRANEEVARFRDERWPEIRDRALDESRKYAAYRTEVVRLEDAMHAIRAFTERAARCPALLDDLERSGFRVGGVVVDDARLDEPAYTDEVLRTIELLHAAIPQRAAGAAGSFSAYRAPTAGPSVTPPRL